MIKLSIFTKHPFTITFKNKSEEISSTQKRILIITTIFPFFLAGIGAPIAFFGLSYYFRSKKIKKLQQQTKSFQNRDSNTESSGADEIVSSRNKNCRDDDVKLAHIAQMKGLIERVRKINEAFESSRADKIDSLRKKDRGEQ